jgi:hypothetical protein
MKKLQTFDLLTLITTKVSHDHIAHHIVSSIPFCEQQSNTFAIFLMNRHVSDNQPEVTEHIKRILMEDYNYDSTVSLPSYLRVWHCIPISSETNEIRLFHLRILSALSTAPSQNAALSKMMGTLSFIKTRTGSLDAN